MCSMTASIYAAQLARSCARLAIGQIDDLPSQLAAGSVSDIDRYLQVGWGERRMLLTQELALVGLAFDDFPTLVDRYLCTTAKVAQTPQSTDHQRFLRWLTRTRQLTPQQRDFIAYQQAEYACLNRARVRRAAHLAFQELHCRQTPAVGPDALLLWHINPVRAWSRLALPDPDNHDTRPCYVIFFAVGERIENVRVSRRQRRWLNNLPGTWARTFEEWTTKTGCQQPDQLRLSLEQWTAAGLVCKQ